MIQSARALGRRAIVSRGWADLSLVDDAPDCLAIGEVNLQALFKRVAAVVHHGGAGTTTSAALAGAPQVVIPQKYDQHYWARRIQQLGIGTAHAPGTPTADSLTNALEHTLATRCGCPCPLHRHCGAHRRRTGRRPTLDHRRLTELILRPVPGSSQRMKLPVRRGRTLRPLRIASILPAAICFLANEMTLSLLTYRLISCSRREIRSDHRDSSSCNV